MSQLPISAPLQATLDKIIKLTNSDRYEAFTYCEAGFAAARAAHDDAAFIAIAIQYGLVIDQHGYPDESINILYEALQLAQSYHHFHDEARLLNVIGRAVYTRAEYRRAMQAWAHCLEVATLADDQVSWVWAKLGIAQIYDALDDHATAVILLQQAQERAVYLHDPILLLNVLLNLGVNLFQERQFEAALQTYHESLALARELNHLDDIGETLFRIAQLLLEQGQITEALDHLGQAQQICEQSHHMWALANIYGVRAQIYQVQNQISQALLDVQHGIDYASASGSAHIEMRLRLLQSQLAEQNHDAELTLAAFRAANVLNSKISPHDHRQQLAELEDLAGLRPSSGRILLELANNPLLERCSLAELAAMLCNAAGQIIRQVRASYWEYLPDQQALRKVHPQLDVNIETFNPPLLQSLQRGETIVAHNAQHHQYTWSLYERLLLPEKLQSVLMIPLRLNESLYGVLQVGYAEKTKNWSTDEVQYMNQLAMIGTRALANIERHIFQADIARLNAQLQQNNNELEARVVERTIELQKAMEHLIETEKLASLGNLVAGFAHELNTPLGNTLTAATTLLDKNRNLLETINAGVMKKTILLQYLDETSMIAELVERNARRASNLIANLKQVAVDTASSKRRQFNLHQVIEETVATLIVSLKKRKVNVFNEVPDDIELNSYPGSLEQIISNFINNSLIHGFSLDANGEIHISAQQINDEQIELSYWDTGVGIAESIKKRVFDPFFTTRFGQGGSGLGLYLVYSLVTGTLGGGIELRDRPAGGVWFVLRLPIVAPAEPSQEFDLLRH
ncbi:tetratricopeptide repeat protein [Chitinibacter fontanus]|uniref:histidine kinase n=1 Tax=Chitinibacter fontanus TaxID=1737446 RepID=A0A7D5VB21_9NEIS|nr:ATP-binding protein [Chitinibacter fontanus]QLI82394.1 tetratricopeptide repeat protein [Chitinibacter fontanus]